MPMANKRSERVVNMKNMHLFYEMLYIVFWLLRCLEYGLLPFMLFIVICGDFLN